MADPQHHPRPDEHAAYAEELLALAKRSPEASSRRLSLLAEAQVHAQLATLGLVSYGMQPARLVMSAGTDVSPEELAASIERAVERRPIVAMPADVDELDAALTHPPVARPRSRAPKKKETAS